MRRVDSTDESIPINIRAIRVVSYDVWKYMLDYSFEFLPGVLSTQYQAKVSDVCRNHVIHKHTERMKQSVTQNIWHDASRFCYISALKSISLRCTCNDVRITCNDVRITCTDVRITWMYDVLLSLVVERPVPWDILSKPCSNVDLQNVRHNVLGMRHTV